MTENEIRERLIELPDAIHTDELRILAFVKKSDGLSKRIASLEAGAYNTVASQVTREGKQIHSNEKKRELATKEFLLSNAEYKVFSDENSDNSSKLNEANIEVERKKRMFSAYKSIAHMISKEV